MRRAAAWLLPQDCFVCGAASGDSLLCAECAGALPRLAAQRCPVCALPTPGGSLCGACLKAPPHFDATVALFEYAFPVEQLIQALKYHGRLALAPFLAGHLAEALTDVPADCLVPLPLHPRRLAERGFNQAAELARPAARKLGLPLLLQEVVREADNSPQAGLPWSQRRRNVRHAFRCTVDLTGKSVVVVDDVMTTGATLDEFARTLKKHGAARITNCVVARTLPQER